MNSTWSEGCKVLSIVEDDPTIIWSTPCLVGILKYKMLFVKFFHEGFVPFVRDVGEVVLFVSSQGGVGLEVAEPLLNSEVMDEAHIPLHVLGKSLTHVKKHMVANLP